MGSADFKIVSFYTPDYAGYAEALKESIIQHMPGTPSQLVPIPQRKWREATCYKASFVREMLDANPGYPILWVDADAVLMGRVTMPEGCDFAIYMRAKDDPLRERFSPFRTGTVFFGQTAAARNLARLWEQESLQQRDGIDQWSLWRAWLQAQADLHPAWLPLAYCQKFDEPGEPLIRHEMASRRLKGTK